MMMTRIRSPSGGKSGGSSRVYEALAWRFLTVLYRCHHDRLAGIVELHPGDGLYDVRALATLDGGPAVMVNLGASLSFDSTSGARPIPGEELWPRLASEGFDGLLDEVSDGLGWSKVAEEPVPVWTYRFISSFLQATALHRPRWSCQMETCDSSGAGDGGLRGRVDLFPGARMAFDTWREPKLYGTAAYFFWCLLRDDAPQLLVDTTGRLWSRKGLIAVLPEVARACSHRTWEMTVSAAGAWLE